MRYAEVARTKTLCTIYIMLLKLLQMTHHGYIMIESVGAMGIRVSRTTFVWTHQEESVPQVIKKTKVKWPNGFYSLMDSDTVL